MISIAVGNYRFTQHCIQLQRLLFALDLLHAPTRALGRLTYVISKHSTGD